MPDPKSIIANLVDKFDRNIEEYKHPKYNETLIRVEFINPFWEALGWDVNNRAGYALSFRDVIHEDDIKVGGSTKAPDYSFRIGGRRMFFLEAKKPAIDLKHNPEPAFQLRRYAYSARLPVSMLSDFEELSIYDTRIKPAISDKAHTGRMHYYSFTEYVDKWDEIEATLSKEAVLRGDFNRFIEDRQAKRPGAELDRDFLASLDEWRMLLARNIALRNPNLSERELNFAVQMTIDRLIFLRMAEDRGIETYGTLQALQNGEHAYKRLVEICYRADERYNSGLFHFDEKDGEHPDSITPGLDLDDKVLKDIIRNVYYPCPYEFREFPVEVLGHAYEQFLGKRISLTSGHRARIEEKPEVRKAGGVYYTPQYIVDYIVEHTVGELVKDKTPKQVSELRIVDPACGSGSFLLGAFQYLMDWHLTSYQAEYARTGQVPASPPPKGKRRRKSDPQAIFQGAEDEWYLTTAEKKRILLNNIYGVDIDANAVEVTKLSLLLKVLEHENSETLNRQLGLWHERALPNLSGNIKCGNSLIGPDYYDNQQSVLFDEEELHRVNAFDWQAEFAEVFAQGGFDAVIGNPPYIRIQSMKEWAPTEVEFYKKKYKSASKGNYDIYVVFIEKGLDLLNKNGLLGFILPHKFFNAKYGEGIRKIVTDYGHLSRIVHFGDQQVFQGATTYTCLLFLRKYKTHKFEFIKIPNLKDWRENQKEITGLINLVKCNSAEWNFFVGQGSEIFEKLSDFKLTLSHVSKIFVGVQTSADPVFVLKYQGIGPNGYKVFSKALKEEFEIEEEVTKSLLKGSEIHTYHIDNPDNLIIFPYHVIDEKAILFSQKELENEYPLTWEYLLKVRKKLESREGGKWKIAEWWQFGRNQNIAEMGKRKIINQVLAKRASFTLDENADYCFVGGGNAGGYGVQLKDSINYDDRFLLGLLNSKLLDWYLKKISTTFRGGFFSYARRFIEKLPICELDFENPADKAAHDRLVELVQQMLELHRRRAAAGDPRTQQLLDRHITTTDQHIDRLVYELYGLTEEEIGIVEGSVRKT